MSQDSHPAEELFERGLRQFNAGEYFDCHDTWEELWFDTRGPNRLFYQGLIQIAVGLYHAGCGNFTGARNLMAKGMIKLKEYPAQHHGVDVGHLMAKAETCRARAQEILDTGSGTFEEELYPTIRYSKEERLHPDENR